MSMSKHVVAQGIMTIVPEMSSFRKQLMTQSAVFSSKAGAGAGAAFGGAMLSSIPGQLKPLGGIISKGINAAGIGLGIGAALAGGIVLGLGRKALAGGWERALNLEDAKATLTALKFTAEEIQRVTESVLKAVVGTAYTLDEGMSLATVALAAGIKPGQDLTDYLKIIADTAIVAKAPLGEIGAIFNKITASGRLYTLELRQLESRSLGLSSWLRKDMDLSAEELTNMMRKGEVSSEEFLRVMKKNLTGAADIAGLTSRGIRANFDAAMSRLGEKAITDALPVFGEFFKRATAWVDTLTQRLAPLATEFWAAFGPKVLELMNFEKLERNIRRFLNAFRDTWGHLKAVAENPLIQSMLDKLKTVFSNPESVAELIKLTVALVALSKVLPLLTTGLLALRGVGKAVMTAGTAIGVGGKALAAGAGRAGTSLATTFKGHNVAGLAPQQIGKAGLAGTGAMQAGFFNSMKIGFANLFTGASGGILKMAANLGKNLLRVLGPVGVVIGIVMSTIEVIGERFGNQGVEWGKVWEELVAWFGVFWDQLMKIFTAIGDAIKPLINAVIDSFAWILKLFSGADNEVDAFGNTLKFVGDILNWVLVGIRYLINGITIVTEAIHWISSAMQNMIIGMFNMIGAGVRELGKLFGQQDWGFELDYQDMPDFIGNVASMDWSGVPNLAMGATILPQPGGTIVRVAEAGRAESVVDTGMVNRMIQRTNARIDNIGDSGGVINLYQTINPSVGMDEVALANAVVSGVKKVQKRYAT